MTRSLWLAGGGGIVGPSWGSTFLKSISDARSRNLWYNVGVNSFVACADGEGIFVEISLSKRPLWDNTLLALTSNRVGLPAEFKHISKRRKRNQPGFP